MKNLLSEKMLLNTKHGRNCVLEVCTAGEPDNDREIFRGNAADCLRKLMEHELAFTGDEYFSLYTNQDNYCGIDIEEISWKMGMDPNRLRNILEAKPSLEEKIRDAESAQQTADAGETPQKGSLSPARC